MPPRELTSFAHAFTVWKAPSLGRPLPVAFEMLPMIRSLLAWLGAFAGAAPAPEATPSAQRGDRDRRDASSQQSSVFHGTPPSANARRMYRCPRRTRPRATNWRTRGRPGRRRVTNLMLVAELVVRPSRRTTTRTRRGAGLVGDLVRATDRYGTDVRPRIGFVDHRRVEPGDEVVSAVTSQDRGVVAPRAQSTSLPCEQRMDRRLGVDGSWPAPRSASHHRPVRDGCARCAPSRAMRRPSWR